MRKLLGTIYRKMFNLVNEPVRALDEDDVLLISYPRSGNTWVRTIIAHLLYGDERIRALSDLDTLVPDLHRGLPDDPPSSPFRVVKSHFSYPRMEYDYKSLPSRIVHIVRRPKNVAKSYFDYLRSINPKRSVESIDAFVHRFVNGAIWPGSWNEHTTGWASIRGKFDYLLIRYEDLQGSTASEIQRLSYFLKRPIGLERAQSIASKCSRENMIQLEKKGSLVKQSYPFIGRTDNRKKSVGKLDKVMIERIVDRSKFGLKAAKYKSDENN